MMEIYWREIKSDYSMEVVFTRDGYGRITGKTSDGSVPVTQTFTYNSRNLLETATDTVGNAATSVTRYYDSFGNPYSEAVSTNNVTKTVSRRMTDAKTYQFTYPDGKTIRKTATGSDLDLIEYGTTGNLAELASYSRANGVITAVTKGQNLTETFTYNTWNQLANHTINNANADIYDMSYNYSRGWHLIEKADGIKNTSDKYTYDSYYRLKEVKYDFVNNAATRTDNFYQDGVHNIEQSTENGITYAWGVDKLNRLRDKKTGGNTAVTYKYDKRNNMIGEDFDGSEPADITYIYDDLNRLIEVKNGSNQTIATYTYDAFNRRITKTVGNTTERYTYDDWNIVEIATNSSDYTNIIDSGTDRHIAIEVTANNVSTLYYFLTDERGNVTALTDANGNVLERYRYRVYGDFEILDSQFTPKNCSNQTCYATNLHNFLWGGSLYEPETGLYWMRNRYYHIDMHRFINQDPIGIWGDANNLGNGFAYVAGMVIEASDPSGLTKCQYGISKIGLKKEMIDFIDAGFLDSAWTFITEHPGEAYISSTVFRDETANIRAKASRHKFGIAIDVSIITSISKTGDPIRLSLSDAKLFAKKIYELTMNSTLKDSGLRVIVEHNDVKNPYVKPNSGIYEMKPAGGISHIHIDFGATNNGSSSVLVAEGNLTLSSGSTVSYRQYINSDGTGFVEYSDGTIISTDGNGYKIIKEGEKAEELKADGFAYPVPGGNEPSDAIQNIIMLNILAKMLKQGDSVQPPFFIDDSTGPNGVIMIYKNPYYVNKDPLKTILFNGDNRSGKPMIYRNPFAPGAEYGYDSTTYQKWQNKGFVQPEVDPWE